MIKKSSNGEAFPPSRQWICEPSCECMFLSSRYSTMQCCTMFLKLIPTFVCQEKEPLRPSQKIKTMGWKRPGISADSRGAAVGSWLQLFSTSYYMFLFDRLSWEDTDKNRFRGKWNIGGVYGILLAAGRDFWIAYFVLCGSKKNSQTALKIAAFTAVPIKAFQS